MEKFLNYLLLFVCLIIGTSCANLKKGEPKIDCRNLVDENVVQKEIQTDLKERFPSYKEAYTASIGLTLHTDGVRYYPVSVKTKENRVYSVIYNYSPDNEMCKKLGWQFIQLEPKP